jgi:ubiquinone biosynthesis protein
LLNVEGLGRQLDPDLDLWKTAKPILERWMQERVGPKAVINRFRANLPRWANQLPELPTLLQELMRQVHSGEVRVRLHREQMNELRQEVRRASRRSFHAAAGAAMIISAALLLGLNGEELAMIWNAPVLSWILAFGGVLLLAIAWPTTES